MEKEVVECALKRLYKESSVSKVLSVDSSPAVGKNENFLSIVSRLTLKVVLGNGRVAKRSLIMKETKSTDLHAAEIIRKYNVFKTETMVYENVLREMENMMEESEDTDDVLWCQLLHYVPYTCLVLEDLEASGFVTMEKGSLMDLDHTLMAFNALGRLHGMSKILEERGILSKEDYKQWFMFTDLKAHQFWVWNMNAAKEGIKKYWSPEWGPILDKIYVTTEVIQDKMKKMMEIGQNKFKVLNHGDCHMNNLMFQHNWENKPIGIKFLDFQLPHYSSPCCDLIYLLYLGPELLVRRNNYELILKTYHESLIRTLEKYHFKGDKPDLQEIKDLMDEYLFIGLYMFVCAYAMQVNSDRDDCFNAEKIGTTDGKEGYNIEIYNNKALEEVMRPDIERFVEAFF